MYSWSVLNGPRYLVPPNSGLLTLVGTWKYFWTFDFVLCIQFLIVEISTWCERRIYRFDSLTFWLFVEVILVVIYG